MEIDKRVKLFEESLKKVEKGYIPLHVEPNPGSVVAIELDSEKLLKLKTEGMEFFEMFSPSYTLKGHKAYFRIMGKANYAGDCYFERKDPLTESRIFTSDPLYDKFRSLLSKHGKYVAQLLTYSSLFKKVYAQAEYSVWKKKKGKYNWGKNTVVVSVDHNYY